MNYKIENKSQNEFHNESNNHNQFKVLLKDKILLGLLNFTTLNRARPGIFVAPYLLMSGWNESHIGWLLFLNCIVSLIVQTPAGIFADSTSFKRSMVAVSNIIIALMCIVLVYFPHVWLAVIVSLAFLGIGYTIAYPAVYSMTLGIVGSEGIMDQVPINETSIHAGNAFFAILSGFVVFSLDQGDTIFWICIIMCILTILVLFLFDPDSISTERARGININSQSNSPSTSFNSTGYIETGIPNKSSSLPSSSSSSLSLSSSSSENVNSSEPMPLLQLLLNTKIIIFYVSIMFFHLSNASMLPLLAQILYKKGDHGFEFSCLCVAVAQLTMILSASFAGYYVRYIGTKPLFILSFIFLPIRGITLMILLWDPNPDPFILVSTQILDGAAGGIFGVMAVLIAENLARGTGHFSVMVGTIKTVESLGAAFSSLCGEQLAEIVNYSVAFGVLSVIAILPIVIYGFGMPSGKRNMFTGEMIEDLSILPNQHQSSYTYPMYSENNHNNNGNDNIDCSINSIDIDSSRTGLNQYHYHQERQYQIQQQQQQHHSMVRRHQIVEGKNDEVNGIYLQELHKNYDYDNNSNSNNNNNNNNIYSDDNNNKGINQWSNDSTRSHTTTRQIQDRLSEM